MNETFKDVLKSFQQFLTNNGYPAEMIWVKKDDVIPSGGSHVFVRLSRSKENAESARKLFELGISRPYGVLFEAIGEIDNASCCRLWIPQSERESELDLMPERGIKMSVRTGEGKLKGKAVRNPVHWLYLKVRYRKVRRLRKVFYW